MLVVAMEIIHLRAPFWLLLIPLLLVAGVYFRALRWRNPWRIVILLVLIVALTEPVLRLGGRGMDLFLLVDRSFSVEETLEEGRHEWESLVRSGQGSQDRLRIIDFAGDILEREDWMPEWFDGRRELTRLRSALEYGLSLADRRRPTRFLVFTDGYSTEPLGGMAEHMAGAGIPVDYRIATIPGGVDYAVRRLRAAGPVQTGEPFVLEGWVEGSPDALIPYVVRRDGERFFEGQVQLRDGRGLVRIVDRLTSPGARRYTLEIQPEQDALEGNNRARTWVEVRGRSGVLVVSPYPDDPVATLLTEAGMEVRLVNQPEQLHEASLQGVDAVVFHNLPAEQLPARFMDSLPFAVREQGVGLLMAGGRGSFGSGGYYGSAMDPLLPVALESQEEHRRVATAMALVLDRSGSMRAPVGQGLTKMDLANNGAAQAVELLGDRDVVTVFTVDTAPHRIVPLSAVGANRAEIDRRIRTMQSMGGGIFVYTGLTAAWEELQQAQGGQKHIILFADTADAEEPGEYQRLLEEITDTGATVSVIGLGLETDKDVEFLRDVARRGNGRIFISNDPAQIPALFAQETVAVARQTFVDEPVGVRLGGGWAELSQIPLDWPARVDSWNVGYYRAGSSLILATDDPEEPNPLAAFRPVGEGRAAAVLFPLAGPGSESVRQWTELPDFVATLTRWIVADETAPGLGVLWRREGTDLEVDFHYDPEWAPIFSSDPPVVLVSGTGMEPMQQPWERMAPGHFRMRLPMEQGKTYGGVIRAGGELLRFGPAEIGLEAEWEFDPERRRELSALARFTGGRELMNLAQAWEAPPRRGDRALLPWLFSLALVLVVTEAAVRRWRGQ